MFNCNNLFLLNFTYYFKSFLALMMTIIPFIILEILFIKLIKYKQKYKVIDVYFFKRHKRIILNTLIIFSISFLLHTILNNSNNKCYMYAKPNIVNEYNNAYNTLKNSKVSKTVKNIYLENTLVIAYNDYLNSNKKEKDNNSNNDNKVLQLNQEIKENKANNYLKETNKNKLNNVYIIDGTFYYPKYIYGNKNTYSGMTCPNDPIKEGYNNPYGYNNYFYERLTKFIDDANKNGYKITMSTQGCRTYNTQVNYYYTMERGRAAYPGYSLHGFGIASDLEFYQKDGSVCGYGRTAKNCPSMGWAHENAKNYGLVFSLLYASYKEDWHIEPINKIKY